MCYTLLAKRLPSNGRLCFRTGLTGMVNRCRKRCGLDESPPPRGVCPPHVAVSMEDVLVMNGIPYEAQMARPQDDAIQVRGAG